MEMEWKLRKFALAICHIPRIKVGTYHFDPTSTNKYAGYQYADHAYQDYDCCERRFTLSDKWRNQQGDQEEYMIPALVYKTHRQRNFFVQN